MHSGHRQQKALRSASVLLVLCSALPTFARSTTAACDAPSIAAVAAADVFGGGVNVAPVDGVARGSSCPEDDSNDALTLLVREGRNLRPLLQRNLSQWQLLKNDVCSTATGRVVSEHAKWSLSAADYAGAGAVHRAEREQRHDRPWTQERILRPSKHAARGRWCMQR